MKTKTLKSHRQAVTIDVAQLRAKTSIAADRLLMEHVQACAFHMNTRATLGFSSYCHEVDDLKLSTKLVNELKKIQDLTVITSTTDNKVSINLYW
jgi:hypothetical protein